MFRGPIRSLRILRIGRIGSGFICYIDYNSEELLFSHLNHVNLHCLRLAAQPDLMTVRINSTPNKKKTFIILICKNLLWRVYAMQWVGLGLWGRCVSYVRENCVSYARQHISYHMHAKTAYYMHAKVNFCVSIP